MPRRPETETAETPWHRTASLSYSRVVHIVTIAKGLLKLKKMHDQEMSAVNIIGTA